MKSDVKILRIFLGFLCILGLVSQVLSVTKEGLFLKSGMLIVISLLGLAGAVDTQL